MLGEPAQVEGREAWMVERAIVLQILRDDHEERWPRSELVRELRGFEPAIMERALARLEREGVLRLDGACVCSSRATRRLDELELIGI
jgi:hypothetical protein